MTDKIIENLTQNLGSWTPHAAKTTGRADQSGSILTPEATPAPEDSLNKSGKTNEEADEEAEEQRKVLETLERILACSDVQYHKILDIAEEYDDDGEQKAIEDAVYDLGIMVHPKHNNDARAEKAWDMVRKAGEELGCREEVIEAVPTHISEESEDGGKNFTEMEGVNTEAPPSKKIIDVYKKATRFMNTLSANPKSPNAKKKLEKLNDEIREVNKGENQEDPDSWTIPISDMVGYFEKAKPIMNRLRKNPSDNEAKQEATAIHEEIQGFISNKYYPLEWNVDVPAASVPAAPVPAASVPAASVPAARVPAARVPAAPVPAAPVPTASVPAPAPLVWRPGLTRNCEQIRGMCPVERDDVDGIPRVVKCTFLVEKKGKKNPLEYQDSGTVGKEASQAYRKLPERLDLRTKNKKYTSADQEGFEEITGIASKEGDNPNIYPGSHVEAKYVDHYKYLNRTGLRSIWGANQGDRMMEDFFIRKDIPIPWLKRAKRPSNGHSDRGRRLKVEEPMGERRSSSRASSVLSTDAGWQRLDRMEDRMGNLEQLMKRLCTQLDLSERAASS